MIRGADILSYCGLDCTSCGVFVAFHTNDDTARAEVVQFGLLAGYEVKKAEVSCKGCKLDKGLFEPSKQCIVRSCAKSRPVDKCLECNEYCCDLVKETFPC